MNLEAITPLLLTVITAATPLVYAALGELVTEKSGVLNLGVEGMMLAGAVTGFAAVQFTGSGLAGVAAGIGAGGGMSLIMALLVLRFHAAQVPSGLALTIFGVGLSALVGQDYVGIAYAGLPQLPLPLLADLPVVGALLFNHDLLVYGSFLATPILAWFLYRTRPGLILRAVGDSHDAAHALGYPVVRVRFLAVLFGGAMAGLAGAYLSLAYSPMWSENLSAGRGWIALALVVFATWRPARVFFGAYLFGGITILQFHAQAFGVNVPAQVMSMLPYLATILVLVLISRDRSRILRNSPAMIGKPFYPEG